MNMLRFEHINYLYGFLVLLVLLIVFMLRLKWIRDSIKKLGDENLVLRLIKNKPKYKYQLKFILFSMAITSLIISLANLQYGAKLEKIKRQGIDLIIALDLSKSMLAEDIIPNRLEKAKQFVYRFVDKLEGDRVGIILFAGNAYVQMPLTVDHSAAKLFLSNANTSLLPTQGTAIGDAIDLSLEMFEAAEKKHKTLIIISDGENHEGDAIESAETAEKEGVIINTVGIGSLKGAPVPVYMGNRQIDYQRDKDNSIVLSKLNENMLEEIAAKGGGEYYRITNSGDDMKKLLKEISGMEGKEFDAKVITDYKSQFQIFLLIALVLLLIEFSIFERKSRITFSFRNLKFTRND